MKAMQLFRTIALLGTFCLLYAGCKKDDPVNPYEGLTAPVQNQNPDADDLPVGSFAWLHAKVFRPTCANSGCHDGTFEPEFRFMGSAYHSLVNHPVIANDPEESFEFRVVPGSAEQSFLYERLTTVVPNTSGPMPLAVEPDSDWPTHGDMYVQKIADWINGGALDMYGNPPPATSGNAPPLVYGIAVFPEGNTTTPYPREVDSEYGIGAILVPPGNVDVWILPYDDNAGLNNFASITLKSSTSATDFSSAESVPFSLMPPITALDFGNNPNTFYYKATLSLTGQPSGTSFFLRNYLDDGVQENLTEVPNNASNYFWYLLFSLKIQ